MLTSEFEALLNKQTLIVRANIRRRARPGETDEIRTMILLWSWASYQESDYLVQIGYVWTEPDGLQAVNPLHVHTYSRKGHLAADQMITQLRDWKAVGREAWRENELVVATREEQFKIPVSHPYLMTHYGRLHVLLGQRRDSEGEDSVLRIPYVRLGGFIRAQANKWREVGLEL